MMQYFVPSSLVQVLVTVSISLSPLSSLLKNLFKAPLSLAGEVEFHDPC